MRAATCTFDEIKLSHVERGTCRSCGKKRQRTLSSSQTVNPFNKNPDGTIKSRDQVRASVKQALDDMTALVRKVGIQCATCEEVEREAAREARRQARQTVAA